MKLKFKKLHKEAIIPKYQSPGSAGFDFCALEWATIHPRQTCVIRTGLAVEVPVGFELQVRQRSGLSMQYPNYIMNSPGTIDSDYRGEIKILIYNHSVNNFDIVPGDRIAQGVLARVEQFKITEVKKLSDTERGKGGFGSTGGMRRTGD
jgi:dUTP pyrophosphatase